jgi:hypothetical protein
MTALLAGTPGLRDRLQRRLDAADEVTERADAALLLVLHTLVDFADFRGLDEAWAALDAAPSDGLQGARADAARLGRPMLDHRHALDDPALVPVARRLLAAVRDGHALPADERMLLAKVLVDFHEVAGNDPAPVEQLLSRMQDVLPQAHWRWQAAWWRIRAEFGAFRGRAEAAGEAQRALQRLAAAHPDPELALAQASEDLRLALHVNDLARAERASRAIEQCRAHVRPALLPHGLRLQAALMLRRGAHEAALAHTRLILDLCEAHAVPERDRAGYVEQQAHALTGLRRHAEAVALLESLRATQSGGQAVVLEAIVAMARAVQALDTGAVDARAAALHAVRTASAAGLHRFLLSFPAWASRIAAIALDAGVETEFLTRAIRERRLPPPEPMRAHWPWPLQVRVLGGLAVLRDGLPLGGVGGKAQRKPLELLVLLAAHPQGLDAETLIDALWPSLEAEAPRASLEMAVSRLRKWLDLPEAVRVADGRVVLDAQCVWTDVGAFEAAAAEGDVPSMLDLYRGPLLQGERLQGLAAAARERLAARLAAAVLQQTAAWRAAGRQADALALLGRGLAAAPGHPLLQAAQAV